MSTAWLGSDNRLASTDSMKLPLEQFKAVVRDSILISLDLLLINEREELLVGRRKHRPAQGYLFVPGGRVMKGETLTAALKRVTAQETGLTIAPSQFVLHGIYDHLYADSCFEEPGLSTQYAVIACRCQIASNSVVVSDSQHEGLYFMSITQVISDPQVHPYVKNYFRKDADNLFLGTETAGPLT